MKKLQFFCVFLVLLAVSGCASIEPSSAQAPSDERYDMQQVAAIEGLARQRGVKVYWMHYPSKNTSDAPR